ncbi:MAG: T9SS type A sorting domain-containing protein [Bacteroidia bacterium]
MKKITYLLLSFFVLILQKMSSQTSVSGGIYTNTHWTLANSPYLVTDTLVLFPGVTLTVDPGVIVKSNSNILIEVRGTINAVGTLADSVQFLGNTPSQTPSFWKGFYINTNAGGKTNFKFCKIAGATYGLYFGFGGYGPLNMSRTSFDHNFSCLSGFTYSGSVFVDSCNFSNSQSGVGDGGSGAGYYSLTNSFFKDNAYGANYVDNQDFTNCTFCSNQIALYTWNGTISNCKIINNNIGYKPANAQSVTISGCIIADNNTGIILNSQSPNSMHNNTICNNHTYNVVHQGTYTEDMTNNCWGDTVAAHISQKIYDGYDNISLGLITFSPYTMCDSSALPTINACSFHSVGTGNNSIVKNKDLRLYPNPIKDYSVIKFDRDLVNGQVTITNVLGEIVFETTLRNEREFILTQHLEDGLYIVRVKENGKFLGSTKLIKD